MTDNSKHASIILVSILFVMTGLFLIIKSNSQLTTSNPTPDVSPAPSIIREKIKVEYVLDGDSIVLTDGRKVRYIGIDAPEKNKCFSQESANINKQLVAGQEIEMAKDISDTDKYGRLLRLVWIEDIFLNDFLLRQGYARLEIIPPDNSYAAQFAEAEKEAKEEKRGLWRECGN